VCVPPSQQFLRLIEGQMHFDFRFEFDVALPAETFSTAIPAGYSRAEAED
jgi:hypothetical protein